MVTWKTPSVFSPSCDCYCSYGCCCQLQPFGSVAGAIVDSGITTNIPTGQRHSVFELFYAKLCYHYWNGCCWCPSRHWRTFVPSMYGCFSTLQTTRSAVPNWPMRLLLRTASFVLYEVDMFTFYVPRPQQRGLLEERQGKSARTTLMYSFSPHGVLYHPPTDKLKLQQELSATDTKCDGRTSVPLLGTHMR